jgi:hypothetical protein
MRLYQEETEWLQKLTTGKQDHDLGKLEPLVCLGFSPISIALLRGCHYKILTLITQDDKAQQSNLETWHNFASNMIISTFKTMKSLGSDLEMEILSQSMSMLVAIVCLPASELSTFQSLFFEDLVHSSQTDNAWTLCSELRQAFDETIIGYANSYDR